MNVMNVKKKNKQTKNELAISVNVPRTIVKRGRFVVDYLPRYVVLSIHTHLTVAALFPRNFLRPYCPFIGRRSRNYRANLHLHAGGICSPFRGPVRKLHRHERSAR